MLSFLQFDSPYLAFLLFLKAIRSLIYSNGWLEGKGEEEIAQGLDSVTQRFGGLWVPIIHSSKVGIIPAGNVGILKYKPLSQHLLHMMYDQCSITTMSAVREASGHSLAGNPCARRGKMDVLTVWRLSSSLIEWNALEKANILPEERSEIFRITQLCSDTACLEKNVQSANKAKHLFNLPESGPVSCL